MSIVRIKSLGITDGTIVNADISSSAAIATTKLGAGAVLQVVQMTSDTQDTTTSTSFVDTVLTLSITPSSTTSKVLIMASFTGGNNTSEAGARFTIKRTSTNLGNGTNGFSNNNDLCSGYHHNNVCLTYLDSPSTTSATTYTIQQRADSSGTCFLNTNSTRGVLILQEISA